MALVWIASRNVDEVREVWPEWLGARKVWGTFSLYGRTCWALEEAHLNNKALYERYTGVAAGAVRLLWGALETGRIVATGISEREKRRRIIEAPEWIDLRVGGHPSVTGFVLEDVYQDRAGQSIKAFSQVTIPSGELLRVFPYGGSEGGLCALQPDLEAVLSEALRRNPHLSQEAARKIARERGVTAPREKIRATLKFLGGSRKPGPKGPRKKRAEPSA